jgi:GntR family transcriptional regulator
MQPTDGQLPSRRLAHYLRAAIVSGDLAPGAKLPSERTLAAQHGVARNTVREAVRLLSDEGLVTAKHGRGVYVREKRRLFRFGAGRYSRATRAATGLSPFRVEVIAQGRTPRTACTSITRVPPPADVAERLGLNPETDTVVRRENWYYADDEPVQLGITYAPWAEVADTPIGTSADLGKGRLYARFADLGHEIMRVREEVTARMPTPDEAQGLAIPDGVPVLDVLHTGIDQQDRAFEVTNFIMRADLNGLDYRMPVED